MTGQSSLPIRWAAALFTIALVAAPFDRDTLAAQDTSRRATVVAGLGNSLGWFGLRAERYVLSSRASLFGGLGVTPAIDPGDPSGLTYAFGMRGYTAGLRHRGFLELSYSQIAVETSSLDPAFFSGSRHYGPGLQVGYQYVARRGFTVDLSVGMGFAAGIDLYASHFQPLLGLGFGYTFR